MFTMGRAMNIAQLHFVDAVASEYSFTAAASKCNVTQPTLSTGISRLEEELGGRLFERTTRNVQLTPLGQHLLPYLREVLNSEKMFLSQAASFLHPSKHLIRIGTSPLINSALIGLVIEPFHRAHANYDFVLREMNMEDLYRMLEGRLLDYVFGVVGQHKGKWASAPLYDEPLMYIPPGASVPAEKGQGNVKLEDIAEDTFLMVPDTCGLARTTRAMFRTNRKKMHEYAGKALGYHILEEWTALNIGAAILPKSKITKSRGYQIKDKAGRVAKISFEAVWIEETTHPEHLSLFEAHLLQVVPKIVRGVS